MNSLNSNIESTKAHFEEWVEASGVSPEIAKLNIESVADPKAIAEFLGWEGYQGSGGWICRGVDFKTGKKQAYGQFKPDTPVRFPDREKPAKYLSCKDINTKESLHDATLLEMPDPNYWQNVAKDITTTIYPTEGVKKGGALLTCGLAGIALPGVAMGFKNGRLVENLKPFFQKGREIVIVFDADIITKQGVRDELTRLAQQAKRCGATVLIPQWDISLGKGIDDVLARHGADKVREIMANAIPYKKWIETLEPIASKPKKKNDLCDLAKKFSTIQDFYGESLRFNELTFECELNGSQLDFDSLRLRCAIDLNLDISKSDADSIFKEVSRRNAYNPVRDYLEECYAKYGSSAEILNELASKVLGANEPLYGVFLKRTLVAAIARIYQPSCKVDHVLCLVGKQGYRKSSFFEALAGDFFTDNLDKDLSNKDNLMRLHRKWICEIGEIDRISKQRDEGDLKNFLTIKSDLMRLPYERTTKEFKRKFIFVGSSNRQDFLTDPTGDRRYWIIPVNRIIDINFVNEHRDLIWAAAVSLYKNGERWWLTDIEKTASDRNNEKYRNSSPILPHIEAFTENRSTVSVAEIMWSITIDISRHTNALQREIVNTLQQIGWEKTSKKMRVNIGGDIKPVNYWVKIDQEGDQRVITLPTPYTVSDSSDFSGNFLQEGDQEGDHLLNRYTASDSSDSKKEGDQEGDHLPTPYTVSDSSLFLEENSKKIAKTFLENKFFSNEENNFEKSFGQKQGDQVITKPKSITTQPIQGDHPPDHPPAIGDHPYNPNPVKPVKKTYARSLKAGDKVRYVGSKFAAIYGNKELVVNFHDGYEIDCTLPDGSYTCKFKVRDRELELAEDNI